MKKLGIFTLLFLSIGILLQGSLPFQEVWTGVFERLQGKSQAWNALLDERIPRLLVLWMSGASLAVAGALVQALFQNPLASPSILGISAGGSLFALVPFAFSWHLSYPFALPLFALLGCLTSLLLVFSLAGKRGRGSPEILILCGIAFTTVTFAIERGILFALRDQWHLIQALTEWEAGSTLDRTWLHFHLQAPLTVMGLFLAFTGLRELDLLALGDGEAMSLGLDVPRFRSRLFLAVALLSGGALAGIGFISFFGFILPHIMRSLLGPRHKILVPACAFGGALVMTGMDFLLRWIKLPYLSIGHISSFIGGLFFLSLLVSKRNQGEIYA